MRKVNWKDPYIKIAVLAFLVIASLMVFYNMLGTVGDVLLSIKSLISTIARASYALIIGLIIAFIIKPYVDVIDVKLGSKIFKKSWSAARVFSILIVYTVTIGFIFLLIALITPVLIRNIKDLINGAPQYISLISNYINGELRELPVFQSPEILSAFQSFIVEYQTKIMGYVSGALSNTVRFLSTVSTATVNMIFGFLIAFYVLLEGNRLNKSADKLSRAIFGEKNSDYISMEVDLAAKIFRNFFNGRIIESFVTALLVLICFVVIGIKYSALIAVLTFVTNMIPYFGPIIGTVITVLLVLLENPTQLVIAVILLLVVNLLDSWIISPRILGNVVGLSPFWVLIGALIGGGLFGFWGIMAGIPAASVLHNAIKRWIDFRLKKQQQKLANTAEDRPGGDEA